MIRSLFNEDDMSSPYLLLAHNLLLEILSGEKSPAQKLPSIREIADSNGVCEATAQRALDSLKREELIYSNRYGKFVTSDAAFITNCKRQYIISQVDSMVKKLFILGLKENEVKEIILNCLSIYTESTSK